MRRRDEPNPYTPPSTVESEPERDVTGWRRPSLWLGIVEIVVGLGLSLRGCVAAIDYPPVPGF